MSYPASSVKSRSAKTIKVDVLARVEGEGGLLVKLKGDRISDLQLSIYEPPRLFEGFLRGRHITEAPDITARICGICPVAYQMSAVQAAERALGIDVHPMTRLLRRLLYCGEWIESHALHVYMLHAPDFLGAQDAFELAQDHREVVERALRLKKIGNHLMTVIGGREIHPVSVAVGGFYKMPAAESLAALTADLQWALETSIDTVRFVSTLPFPDFEQDYEFVALSHPEEYAIADGRLQSNRGIDIDPAQYEDVFVERHVRHSNALHSQVRDRGTYHVGPLARYNLNFQTLTPRAKAIAEECGACPPVTNPFRSIVARAVELVFACEESLRLIEQYQPPPEPRIPITMRAATGHAITEAPRGILYHRYSFDDSGLILSARIVPPTAQNLRQMEEDLLAYLPGILHRPDDEITWRAEQAVRNYDPCISCATHFLKLRKQHEPE